MGVTAAPEASTDSAQLRSRNTSFTVKFANLTILESLRLRQSTRKRSCGSVERRISHDADMNRLEEQYYDLVADYHYFRDVSCALNRLRNRVRTERDARMRLMSYVQELHLLGR